MRMSDKRKQSSMGTFTHNTYIGMSEGDDARNKHWCWFYRNSDNKCCHPNGPYTGKHCQGASYCQEYKEYPAKKRSEN